MEHYLHLFPKPSAIYYMKIQAADDFIRQNNILIIGIDKPPYLVV